MTGTSNENDLDESTDVRAGGTTATAGDDAAAATRGPWSLAETDRFLVDCRAPIRIATNGSTGHPVLASLWFVPLEGRLWCATHRGADIVRLLERDPRCAFEVSVETPPYRGVRGSAIATLDHDRGESILRMLLERQLGGVESDLARKLLARSDEEVAIGIEPRRIVTWDFTQRMQGIAAA